MNKLLDLDILKKFKKIFSSNIQDFRIVGGAVRSYLLNNEIKDIDIATILNPDELLELANENNIKLYPSGLKYGTQTIIIDDKKIEITSLRNDIKTDGRHAQVKYCKDWHEDSKRRDFTINAIYMDFDGNIHDYHLDLKDIKNKIIRFIGEPEERIKEDYLRILRLFRFYAELENFSIEIKSENAAKKFANKISKLSKERIKNELEKLCISSNYAAALSKLAKNNILSDILDINPSTIDKLNKFKGQNNISPGLIVILANLVKEKQLLNLALSNSELDNINFLKKIKDLEFTSLANIKKNLFIYGRKKSELAFINKKFNKKEKLDPLILKKISETKIPIFPITGEDLKKEGFNEGPELGKELDKRVKNWLDNDFTIK